MANQKNGISWTDQTWNPIVGCFKVSAGCEHCWAEKAARLHYRDEFPEGWDGHIKLFPKRLEQPLHWRKPRRIAVGLMGDLFHDHVPDEFIEKVWAVMEATPKQTWQILTKRPERMEKFIKSISGATDNIWLGVSVEDQKTFHERWSFLRRIKALVRFINFEPLLGPIESQTEFWEDLGKFIWPDWVIVGGESGPDARPMHPAWVRSLRDQCVSTGTPFHFKQWGEWAGYRQSPTANGSDFSEPYRWDNGIVSLRVGKKAAGRLIDGKIWNEFPEERK